MAIVLTTAQARDLRISLLDSITASLNRNHFHSAADYSALYDLLAAAGSITLGDDFALVASADAEAYAQTDPPADQWEPEPMAPYSHQRRVGEADYSGCAGRSPHAAWTVYGQRAGDVPLQPSQGRFQAGKWQTLIEAEADRQQADDERRNAWRAL